MNRIQKLPPVLWTEKPLTDKNTYVFFYSGKEKKVAKVENPEVAMQKIVAATKAGYGAFASTFIPCNNQHGVFAFSTAGCTKQYALAKNVFATVDKAYKSVFAKVETKPSKKEEPVQKIISDEDDPPRIVIRVKYDGSDKIYTFRCRQWHLKGDRVCVHTCGEHKPVTVEEALIWRESQIKAFAKSIGRDDLEFDQHDNYDPEDYDDLPD